MSETSTDGTKLCEALMERIEDAIKTAARLGEDGAFDAIHGRGLYYDRLAILSDLRALAATLDGMERDRARLDWLSSDRTASLYQTTDGQWHVEWMGRSGIVLHAKGDTPRAALDKAGADRTAAPSSPSLADATHTEGEN